MFRHILLSDAMTKSVQSLQGHQPNNPKQKLLSFSFVKLLGFVVRIKDFLTTMSPLITYVPNNQVHETKHLQNVRNNNPQLKATSATINKIS